eukprot:jgi/Mesen1/2504/ME000159S01630
MVPTASTTWAGVAGERRQQQHAHAPTPDWQPPLEEQLLDHEGAEARPGRRLEGCGGFLGVVDGPRLPPPLLPPLLQQQRAAAAGAAVPGSRSLGPGLGSLARPRGAAGPCKRAEAGAGANRGSRDQGPRPPLLLLPLWLLQQRAAAAAAVETSAVPGALAQPCLALALLRDAEQLLGHARGGEGGRGQGEEREKVVEDVLEEDGGREKEEEEEMTVQMRRWREERGGVGNGCERRGGGGKDNEEEEEQEVGKEEEKVGRKEERGGGEEVETDVYQEGGGGGKDTEEQEEGGKIGGIRRKRARWRFCAKRGWLKEGEEEETGGGNGRGMLRGSDRGWPEPSFEPSHGPGLGSRMMQSSCWIMREPRPGPGEGSDDVEGPGCLRCCFLCCCSSRGRQSWGQQSLALARSALASALSHDPEQLLGRTRALRPGPVPTEGPGIRGRRRCCCSPCGCSGRGQQQQQRRPLPPLALLRSPAWPRLSRVTQSSCWVTREGQGQLGLGEGLGVGPEALGHTHVPSTLPLSKQ